MVKSPVAATINVTNQPANQGASDVPLHQFTFGHMEQDRQIVKPKCPKLFNGMPAIAFLDSEVEKLAEPFELALVGKFSYGVPKIYEVTKMIKELRLKGGFTVSFMDKNHVLIKLFREEDLTNLWLTENPNVSGIPIRFFKRSPRFSLEDESPVVPIWVTFENLPVFLFHKEALYEIGKLLGKPVKVDGYTPNKNKLHQANICIKVFVSVDLPSHVWIKVLDKGTAIKLQYNNIPTIAHIVTNLAT